MFKQIGYIFSVSLAILAGLFFLASIFFGYKYYDKLLLGQKTGLKLSIISVICLSSAMFVFLTVENGFNWGVLGFSFCLAVILIVSLMGNDFVRTKTVTFLKKENSLSPFSPLSELIAVLTNAIKEDSAIERSDKEDKNKK